MIRAFFLFCGFVAAAAPQRVLLVEDLVRLEAMERRTIVIFPLEQQAAELEVRFSSKRGGEGVRLAVYIEGSSEPLADSVYALDSALRVPLERHRTYRIEAENMRQRLGFALVDIEATLLFGMNRSNSPAGAAKTLSPTRMGAAIGISTGLFLLLAGYTAMRLRGPVGERWRGER